MERGIGRIVRHRLPFTVLRDALFTHPTAAEGLTMLVADLASGHTAHRDRKGGTTGRSRRKS